MQVSFDMKKEILISDTNHLAGRAPRERKEKAQKKPEKGDNLDGLISKYRESLFGDPKNSQKEFQKSSLKRWFE